MLSPEDFHPYQKRAIQLGTTDDRFMFWLSMGLGKTSAALTIFKNRRDALQAYRCLVVAPVAVAKAVWRQEIEKWSHLQDLRAFLLRGSKSTLIRVLYRDDYDIHLINYEALPWLVNACNEHFLSRGQHLPWNMIIFDEVDRMKHDSGKRFRAFEPLLQHFTFRIGLTGTPGANGYIDLHGQYKVIDDGDRLYQNVTDFRTKWFKAGYAQQSWDILPNSKEEIHERIRDITFSLNADEIIKLPDYQFHDHWVDLDPELQREYDRLEKDMFASFDRHDEDPLDGEWTLIVNNASSARTKCRQLANGCVIDPAVDSPVPVHDKKLEALDSIIHEAAGNPVFVTYLFRADMQRIRDRYAKQGYRVGYIGPGNKDVEGTVDAWNRQEFHILLAHCMSAGHGLNLQFGGNEIVHFGLTDNLAYYLQVNARLRRQGQAAPNVHVRRILARKTVDVLIDKLLDAKEDTQNGMRKAIEDYRKMKDQGA